MTITILVLLLCQMENVSVLFVYVNCTIFYLDGRGFYGIRVCKCLSLVLTTDLSSLCLYTSKLKNIICGWPSCMYFVWKCNIQLTSKFYRRYNYETSCHLTSLSISIVFKIIWIILSFVHFYFDKEKLSLVYFLMFFLWYYFDYKKKTMIENLPLTLLH